MLASQRHIKPPFAGHPVYDEETRNYVATPRPAPRVKPEAQEYANRNKSSFSFGFEPMKSNTQNVEVAGRYCSLAGMENLRRSRGTWSLSNEVDPEFSASEPVRCRATKPEATQTAELSKGGRMNLLLTNYGKNQVTPRSAPRVKMEASQNYQMARGGVMNSLLHDAKSLPATARAGPRVKPEAELIAMKNRGSMNAIMRVYTPRY